MKSESKAGAAAPAFFASRGRPASVLRRRFRAWECNSTVYNSPMFRSVTSSVVALFFLTAATVSTAQAPKKAPAASGKQLAEQGTGLAESGHCDEALSILKKAIHQTLDRNLKKRVGLDGIHCAMTHDVPYDSLDFLDVLGRDFPNDPEVLYAPTHPYSVLSIHPSPGRVT